MYMMQNRKSRRAPGSFFCCFCFAIQPSGFSAVHIVLRQNCDPCINRHTAKVLAIHYLDAGLDAEFSHDIRVLSHCACQITIRNQTFDRIRFIESNANQVCISGSLDRISNSC